MEVREASGDPVTERIIGCALEVHRQLGAGLLESAYEAALCIEFEEQGVRFRRQAPVPIVYKGRVLGDYRLDLLVEESVVVEVKSVERLDPIFHAQILTYMRASGRRVGLLINFNSRLLKDGIKRFVV
jgi:GxxExxY protein